MISQIILLTGSTLQSAVLETIQAILSEKLPGCRLVHETIDSKEQADWEIKLSQLADDQEILLIFAIGGIDPVGCVPDATKAVCPKLFPGFGTILRHVAPLGPAALLWRNTAGLRNQTLIVNLPDSVEAIRAGLPLLFPAIPNAIRLAGG